MDALHFGRTERGRLTAEEAPATGSNSSGVDGELDAPEDDSAASMRAARCIAMATDDNL